jgi:hypothetical protein
MKSSTAHQPRVFAWCRRPDVTDLLPDIGGWQYANLQLDDECSPNRSFCPLLLHSVISSSRSRGNSRAMRKNPTAEHTQPRMSIHNPAEDWIKRNSIQSRFT